MSYWVRYTKAGRDDLEQLYGFLLDQDLARARRARIAIGKAMEFLRDFPFACRKTAPDNPFLRELLIPFSSGGYVVLFEIESKVVVTILAVRHQREDDYH